MVIARVPDAGVLNVSIAPGALIGTIAEKPRPRSATGRQGAALQSAEARVQVCVRLRPLNAREREHSSLAVWIVDDEGRICLAKAGSVPKYAFDTVHREEASNRDVYQSMGAPVVRAAVQGINGTIFAYGVTSSGKTHTMMGAAGQPGLVAHALEDLFAEIARCTDRVFLLRFCMLEIYNEVINDLLEPSGTNLRLREDKGKGMVYVDGATNIEVRRSGRRVRGFSGSALDIEAGMTRVCSLCAHGGTLSSLCTWWRTQRTPQRHMPFTLWCSAVRHLKKRPSWRTRGMLGVRSWRGASHCTHTL